MKKLRPLTEAEIKRYWSHVQKGGPTDCWPSRGQRTEIGGIRYTRMRIAIWLATGVDPGDIPVARSCACPSCLNPAHLTLQGSAPPPEGEVKVKERPDPTSAEIHRLKGKIGLMEDELRHAKQTITSNAKTTSLFEMLAEHAATLITPFSPPKILELPDPAMEVKTIEEHLVMHLSDEHADETVIPHQVGGFEDYNFPIALARAERYVDTTIKFTRQTLANYHFPVLWILAYGDHTSGEIHKSVDRSYYKNQLRNCLAIGQMHAMMIRDLSAYFPEINVLYLPGNHGRRSVFIKKDYNNPWDSWDYLIGEIASMHCAGLKGVKFHIPDAFNVVLDINGYGFHIQHGDDIPSWNSLPWYGIERQTRRLAALHNTQGRKVSYYVMGHFHKPASLGDLNGETIVNGPWVATNPYSYGKFASFTEPTQWIHGVHPKHGISWRLNVKLRHPEEKQGPKRYRVQLAEAE